MFQWQRLSENMKRHEETAKKYVESGRYAWNSGMFIWKASAILRRFEALIPDIYADLRRIGDAMGTPDEQAVLEEVYPGIRKISVDYAIMEPAAAAGDVLVVLEAMKMENEIFAPKAGTVAQVLVQKGATVDTGATMVVIA